VTWLNEGVPGSLDESLFSRFVLHVRGVMRLLDEAQSRSAMQDSSEKRGQEGTKSKREG